jgi:tRNA threonylcarbamoyl adenosine modification protein YeaZ
MLTVAVIGDDVTATGAESAPNRHGERLMPLVNDTMRRAGVAMRDLNAVGVGIGPGPFTGLRVGIVTAAALGDALGVPVYGMCSLDAIAESFAGGRAFAVVTDARRRQVYWATYDADGRRVDGPRVDEPAEVATQLVAHTNVVVGAGATMYAETFASFELIGDRYPDASALAASARARRNASETADVLEPLYLRRPDAVPPAALKKVTPA